MKQFSILFIFLGLFSAACISCNNGGDNGNVPQKTDTTTITIIGIDSPNHSQLLLQANGNPVPDAYKTPICVGKGAKVIWKIDSGSGVDVIAEIARKEIDRKAESLLEKEPVPDKTSGTWSASVKDNAQDCASYRYKIMWRAKGDTMLKVFDPVIAIRPSKDTTTCGCK